MKGGSTIRLVGAVSAALAGPAVLAAKSAVPQATWWDGRGFDPALYLVVVIVLLGVIYAVWKVFDEVLAERQQAEADAQALVEHAFRHAMVILGETIPAVPLHKVGLHLWRVDADAKRLQRVAKYTLSPERRETLIEWTEGKGVIGVAWHLGEPIIADLTSLHALAAKGFDRAVDDLPSAERYGLTAAELRRSSRYVTVAALPLGAGDDAPGETLGVMSIDVSIDGVVDDLTVLLNGSALDDDLAACQNYLRLQKRGT